EGRAAPADASWWRGYGDADLDALIERVIAVNGDLASAGLRLAQARISAGLAMDDQLPHASATLRASQSRAVDRSSPWVRSSGATFLVD
ncbi:hypothetical protein NL529_29455, partial [Klebsiella pneumoniae]|nr:hypothetical protein [Klebsiella pneumoniae]